MTIVLPIDDVEEHDEHSTTCKCNPSVIYENGDMILVHDAFDGRQEWEKAGIVFACPSGWRIIYEGIVVIPSPERLREYELAIQKKLN